MTVIMLQALLYHYTTPDPWPTPPSRSYNDALAKLRAETLVDVNKLTGAVTVTERGVVFVNMLRGTPLPVQKWADPRE